MREDETLTSLASEPVHYLYLKAIDAWQAENIERIVIKPNKKEHISDRIQIAIDRGITKSRQAYILDAVRKSLEEDGIPMIED